MATGGQRVFTKRFIKNTPKKKKITPKIEYFWIYFDMIW